MIALLRKVFKNYSRTAEDMSFEDAFRGAIDKCGEPSTYLEKVMLEGVLDLSGIAVYDVMNHRGNLFAVDIDLPTEQILEKVKDCPFSRVPLYKDKLENIVGVIRVKNLFKEVIESKGDFSKVDIRKIMTAPWFIPDNTNLRQQLQLFRARREHFAIVVDEYGVLQGIVTLEDILEEIVGDINDESDIANLDIMGICKAEDGVYIVDGQVPIRDLKRKFGWEISDDYATTIAGYLLDMTQSIPSEGQKFVFEGFQFEVIKRKKNQICSIKINKL